MVRAMSRPSFFTLAISTLLVAACSKTPAATSDAGASPADGGAAAVAPLASDAAVGLRDAGASKPTSDDRARVAHALHEGRTKARAKDWAGALASFERGLAAAPNDPTLLAETAWAAFNTSDLAKAESAARRGLAVAKRPNLRAQILYTAGRIAEAKNESDAARRAYGESLALRDNAEVKRRLSALGGSLAGELVCAEGAASIETLCGCLRKRKADLIVMEGDEVTCRSLPVSLTLGTPRLSVVRWGSTSEAQYLLVAHDGPTFRPVAELGRDYEPGAFGVHNGSTVPGGEKRKLGEREVFVVKSEVRNTDMNLAGLEECFEDIDRETVCALGDEKKPTRCIVVPVSTKSGCGQGVEPDPSELDDAMKELLAERKAGWSSTSSALTWSISPQGKLVVRAVGDASASSGPVGEHPLW